MSPLLFRRLSDETLGSRLASGEAAAFDELYRRYVHRLAAYGAHLLGDAAAGEDVAHSALLKAYGALRDGKLPERVRPWLYRIAHNTAIDLVARRRELPAAELPETAVEEPAVEDSGERGALVAALAELPERQRRVYALRELHGLRIDETAAELELTSAQVEQALFAARNRLAELLVFGERLSCVAVRRLVEGPLDSAERRALKTHLRSCPECRAAVGPRAASRAGWLPGPLAWIRDLVGIGGGPIAAKVGAAVATATVATGVSVPLAIHAKHRTPPDPVAAAAAASAPKAHVPTVVPRTVESAAAPATARTVAAVVVHEQRAKHAESEHHGVSESGRHVEPQRGEADDNSDAVVSIAANDGEHGSGAAPTAHGHDSSGTLHEQDQQTTTTPLVEIHVGETSGSHHDDHSSTTTTTTTTNPDEADPPEPPDPHGD